MISGKLKAGEKQPPHRERAYQKSVSLGTASRVYEELGAIDITRGKVGRGSFVRHPVEHSYADFINQELPKDVIDFSRSYMILPKQNDLFSHAVSTVLGKRSACLKLTHPMASLFLGSLGQPPKLNSGKMTGHCM